MTIEDGGPEATGALRPFGHGEADRGEADGEAAGRDEVTEQVRRRLAALDGIEHLPLAEHAERYDDVHAELQTALTEIDGESGG